MNVRLSHNYPLNDSLMEAVNIYSFLGPERDQNNSIELNEDE